MDTCIYCGAHVDSSKGEGDHILPVQFGEFRSDKRFRRICPKCNTKIGHSEQQLLTCAPEAFLRRLVNPKVPRGRQRGKSQIKAAMGAPSPESTVEWEDHRELVERSPENPTDVFPVDQIVIHDDDGNEYFIKIFPGMKKAHVQEQIEKQRIPSIQKVWFHFDEVNRAEFEKLITSVFPDLKKGELPPTEIGVVSMNGRMSCTVTDHYFRSIAKLGFHYYLTHCLRGYRGDEALFKPIRDFIMNGGEHDVFFDSKGPKFAIRFGELISGGMITPDVWCHILAAFEKEKQIVAYVQLFVGPGCVPPAHHIKLADIDNTIIVPKGAWGHVYVYDKAPRSGRYAGEVKRADVRQLG